jgi:hypothetical protein
MDASGRGAKRASGHAATGAAPESPDKLAAIFRVSFGPWVSGLCRDEEPQLKLTAKAGSVRYRAHGGNPDSSAPVTAAGAAGAPSVFACGALALSR